MSKSARRHAAAGVQGVILTALTGCALVSAPAAPAIDPTLVSYSPVADGKVRVSGLPGAVSGKPWEIVVAIHTGSAPPGGSAHPLTDGHYPLVSQRLRVAADGSFCAVTLGETSTPVRSGDELNLRLAQIDLGNPGFAHTREVGKNLAIVLN